MIGIFIEPSGTLRKNINFYKKKIKKNLINSTYSDHPPHSTIFFSDLNFKPELKEKLEHEISQIKSFKIKINKISVFQNDISTGKNTYFFKIIKNRYLNKLQEDIVTIIKPNLNKSFLKKKLDYNNMNFNYNFRKYGYPFIGKCWKPHFTIASCELNRKNMELKKFLPINNNYLMLVKYISIWRIYKNKHILIKKIKLKKNNEKN
jgi:hypothetical protein